jgi:hypothetical protein
VFVERREFTAEEVLQATEKFAQPHLLEAVTENVETTSFQADVAPGTSTIVGPFPMET